MRKASIAAFFVLLSILLILAALVSINSGYGAALLPNYAYVGITIFTAFSLVIAFFQWLLPLTSKKPTIKNDKEISLDKLSEELLSHQINASISTIIVELKNDVKSVVKEVEEAQDTVKKDQPELEITKTTSNDIDKILDVASVNSSASLLLLSAKIEEQMRIRIQEAGLQPKTNYALSRQAIDMAVKQGIIPQETVSAFHDFLAVRNKIAHGAAFDVEEKTILALVSIGIELLKVISAKKRKEPELSGSDMP